MKGTVKFYDLIKNWGFIKTEENTELFFHASEFLDKKEVIELMKGVEVEFEIGDGKKGKKAINIHKIKNEKKE